MYPVNHKSQDVIMTVIKKPAAVNIVLAPQMLQKKHYPVVSKSVIARFSFNDVCTCISDVPRTRTSGAVDNLGLTNLASITPPGTVFWILISFLDECFSTHVNHKHPGRRGVWRRNTQLKQINRSKAMLIEVTPFDPPPKQQRRLIVSLMEFSALWPRVHCVYDFCFSVKNRFQL